MHQYRKRYSILITISLCVKYFEKSIYDQVKIKKYSKRRAEQNLSNYKNQINFCVNLLRKTKTKTNLLYNIKNLSENKKTLF